MEKKDAPVILDVEHLKQYFNKDTVKAVDDISFHIYKGETFGLVGESGSGKTTTGRAIIRLYNPTSGKITFEGEDISKLKGRKEFSKFRSDIQMIFQDPYASLNPRMKVRDIIAEGIDINHLAKDNDDRNQQVDELLETVGLSKEHATRYPHEFSGGQRQRIGIARALAVKPKFIIADEPISALDVSIQAQVVNLLKELQRERDLTYLFIAHDLSMVKYISDRIGVMHYGQMLEIADADELYEHPLHDYTRSLLSSVPFPDPEYERKRKVIDYDPAQEHDGKERTMVEIAPGHFVRASEDEIPKYKQRLTEKPLFD
ncbi:ABC transporter ATP-binding protein [Lactobacillaceae bacterium Melli_B4]